MVTIQYYLGIEWELPMIIILFICFTAGTIFGYFSCLLQKLYKKQ
ncbi:LapA family protein [Nitrosomonas halophila]